MQRYNPKDIETKWQKNWQTDSTYSVDLKDTTKPKFYGFAMLPYPSGTGLHTGHVRTYTLADVTVRAKRQQGFNAYNPIGWDAFGLPAENYAIKTGISPKETIAKATDRFREQLSRIGMSHDWDKEINTSNPEYYRWTQWVFTKLFEHGLAYQKESSQWWCSLDKTVLANEQVINGKCWRHDGPNDPLVTKKSLKQWFFKITDYADELLEATDDLDWPNSIKTMQKNWIGRSKGAEVAFTLADNTSKITVFTTRPDTIFGATFLVLAPEHPLVQKLTKNEQSKEVKKYVVEAEAKSDIDRMDTGREKTGVFTGSYAINPANDQKIPIWIADYVLMGYGTGAIMAVPAHDERDHDFAKKFELGIVPVVTPIFFWDEIDNYSNAIDRPTANAIGYDPKTKKYCVLDWYESFRKDIGYDWPGGGMSKDETVEQAAVREFAEETGYADVSVEKVLTPVLSAYYMNEAGAVKRAVKSIVILHVNSMTQNSEIGSDDYEKNSYKVRWLTQEEIIANQNSPINRAISEFAFNKTIHVGEGSLINSGSYNGLDSSEAREKIVADLAKKGVAQEKVNYKIHDWLISRQRYWGAPIPIIHCAKDGAVAVPESELPVILPEVKSYQPTGEGTSVLADVKEWVNTTCPKCGGPAKRETDTMDGYACSSWYFMRYLDPHNDKQAWDPAIIKNWMPIDFYNGADHAVSHLLYARFWMRFFYKLGLVGTPEPVKRLVYNAYILATDGTKMSKSKGNVVDPLEVIDSGYGADALRVYEMFIAPYDMEAPWNTQGVPGCYRFLRRFWDLAQAHIEATGSPIVAGDDGKAVGTSQEALEPATENAILQVTHKTIKKVTSDIENVKFNTAIAAMMEMVNDLYKFKTATMSGKAWRTSLESLAQLLAPFAPHMCEELWHQLGHKDSVHKDHWPTWDDKFLAEKTAKIVVQINGKLRATLELPSDSSQDAVQAAAFEHERIQELMADQKPKRIVYVPGRLLNIVL
ncbi:MAG TPA: class I tRNA ligase family protein [Patescibacteria group bacterium]|nr:class I tRNA ligase family protein [Patescibacteria group bacterium]